jgi:hypothetical protein
MPLTKQDLTDIYQYNSIPNPQKGAQGNYMIHSLKQYAENFLEKINHKLSFGKTREIMIRKGSFFLPDWFPSVLQYCPRVQ